MTDNRTTETATGRLRALLNERDAEWKQGMAWNVTVINGDWLVVEDVDFGTLSVSTMAYMLTPEQAIAATLGSGECEIVEHYAASTRGEIGRERVKLSCGHIVERHSKFCQECGAKVVDE